MTGQHQLHHSTPLPRLSRHAARRLERRGIPYAVLGVVWQHHDWELHAGNSCRALRLSQRRQTELVGEGTPAQLVDKAGRVILVVNPEGEIVTAMHDWGRVGRRYRRQHATHRSTRRHGRSDLRNRRVR